jgi:hypothetical protein
MNKIRNQVLFFLLFAALFFLEPSCANHEFPSYTCPPEPISFADDISPIIMTKCAIEGCHNGDNGADKNWTNFDLFQENAKNGLVKSYVVNRIMPKAESSAGPLSQEQINAIACWVDQGAQNN